MAITKKTRVLLAKIWNNLGRWWLKFAGIVFIWHHIGMSFDILPVVTDLLWCGKNLDCSTMPWCILVSDWLKRASVITWYVICQSFIYSIKSQLFEPKFQEWAMDGPSNCFHLTSKMATMWYNSMWFIVSFCYHFSSIVFLAQLLCFNLLWNYHAKLVSVVIGSINVYILIFFSETTGPIGTKLGRNVH